MTVQSVNGALEVGLTACRRALPDVTDLADHVVHEFELLRGLMDALEPKAPVAAAVAAVQVPPVDGAAVVGPPAAKKRSRVRAPAVKAVVPLPVERGAKRSAPRARARGATF